MYGLLCALDMSVHGTRVVYDIGCLCGGLYTLDMTKSAMAQLYCTGARGHRMVWV